MTHKAKRIIQLTPEQQKLAEDNLKFVYFFMNKYGIDEELTDLLYIELCKAARSYESDKGITFTSYASKIFINAVKNHWNRSDGKAQKENIVILHGDAPLMTDEEGNTITLFDVIEHPIDPIDDAIVKMDFEILMKRIPESHRSIITMRLQGCTQKEIANHYDCSGTHIGNLLRKYMNLNNKMGEV